MDPIPLSHLFSSVPIFESSLHLLRCRLHPRPIIRHTLSRLLCSHPVCCVFFSIVESFSSTLCLRFPFRVRSHNRVRYIRPLFALSFLLCLSPAISVLYLPQSVFFPFLYRLCLRAVVTLPCPISCLVQFQPHYATAPSFFARTKHPRSHFFASTPGLVFNNRQRRCIKNIFPNKII